MNIVESEDGVGIGKEGNGDSIACPDIHAHHRRSKRCSNLFIDFQICRSRIALDMFILLSVRDVF